MAKEPEGTILVKEILKGTALQKKLYALLNDKEARREAHRILGERCNQFVPMKSGELRGHMHPYPQTVRWEMPYAKYQYQGEVWGPNHPVYDNNGRIIGWETESPRRPMGRMLGAHPHEWKGWRFGYTTPNTGHHWLDKAMENGGLRAYSISVTAMLKRRARKLNK